MKSSMHKAMRKNNVLVLYVLLSALYSNVVKEISLADLKKKLKYSLMP